MTDIRTMAVCGKVKRIISEAVEEAFAVIPEPWPGMNAAIAAPKLSALVALDLLSDDMPESVMDAIRAAVALGQAINAAYPAPKSVEHHHVAFDAAHEEASAFAYRFRVQLERSMEAV